MTDRDTVIKGLERCKLFNKINCDKCPYDYNGRGNGKSECTAELATDVLALLKEQETVVQCKDCEHCYFASNRVPMERSYACEKHGIDVTPDWYCADGKRKEDSD